MRFQHIPEEFFGKLDFESLANARLVAISWEKFIDEREQRWHQIKDGIADLKKKCWGGKTPFHLACMNSQAGIAEFIVKNSANLNIDLNARDNNSSTAFHYACGRGHAKIAEIIMKNSAKFNIELNTKSNNGWTAFHFACYWGKTSIVEMMISNSESLKLDLTAKDKYGRTGYKWVQACRQESN